MPDKTAPEHWPEVVVVTQPEALFLKDVGGKKSHLTMHLGLDGRVPEGAVVRLTAMLYYESKDLVEEAWQHVFQIMALGRSNVWVMSNTEEEAVIKFRIERVSSNFQGRKFRVGLDVQRVSRSGTETSVGTIFSEAIEVRAKHCQKGKKAARRRRLERTFLENGRPQKRARGGAMLPEDMLWVQDLVEKLTTQQRRQREAMGLMQKEMERQLRMQARRFDVLQLGLKCVFRQAMSVVNDANHGNRPTLDAGGSMEQEEARELFRDLGWGEDHSSVYHVRDLENASSQGARRRPFSMPGPHADLAEHFRISAMSLPPRQDYLEDAAELLADEAAPFMVGH